MFDSADDKDLVARLHDILKPFLLRSLKSGVEKKTSTSNSNKFLCWSSTITTTIVYENFNEKY